MNPQYAGYLRQYLGATIRSCSVSIKYVYYANMSLPIPTFYFRRCSGVNFHLPYSWGKITHRKSQSGDRSNMTVGSVITLSQYPGVTGATVHPETKTRHHLNFFTYTRADAHHLWRGGGGGGGINTTLPLRLGETLWISSDSQQLHSLRKHD